VDVVGWGVVGCGWVSREFVIPALRSSPDLRLIGIYDTDPAAGRGIDIDQAATLEELLAQPEVDAVYVATPNDAHRSVVIAAAARGKAVLCEKPLSADRIGARAAVAACRGAGIVAGTAFDQRFHPAHQVATGLIADGVVGTVTTVRIVYGCWLPPEWSGDGRPRENWRTNFTRAGGGAAIDLAPHGVDLIGVLLGEDLCELSAMTACRVHPYDVEDSAVLVGATPSGILASLHVSYAMPEMLTRRRLEVVGTAGQLVAIDTMGQTAGGTLNFIDSTRGHTRLIAFDSRREPFAGQLAAFSLAVADCQPWRWPLKRDLRLHELLLDSLPAEPTMEVPCR
jgi:1,5-anhydro-D-fructose reductase (1,5-anhydro-D-mannitol-forming)